VRRIVTALGYAFPWLFRRRVAVVGIAFALTAGVADAGRTRLDVVPSFVATPVQQAGGLCVAPCAYHFDATATTSVQTSKPFHDLSYEWIFGDGGTDSRAIAGHVYEQPGTYQVVLVVTDALGSAKYFVPQFVHVANPALVARIDLQRGQTYSAPSLAASGGGIVRAVGTGAPPVITGTVTMRPNWTLTGVDVRGGIQMPPMTDGVTIHDVSARGVSHQTGQRSRHSDRFALSRSRIQSRPTGTLVFLSVERGMVLDNYLDNEWQGEFNLRTVHFPRSVIARNEMRRPGDPANGGGGGQRNNLQLRGWATPVPPPNVPTEYVVIADNVLLESTGEWIIRGCASNLCGSESGSPPLRNVLVEGNRAVGSMREFVNAQGSDWTVRGNDLTEWSGRWVTNQAPAVGSSGSGGIEVYGNDLGGRPAVCSGGAVRCE
jgi:PKD repeat protein